MATVTKNWANGDLLTLVTSAGGIAVSSAENLTGVDREMTIRVQTTNQGTKAFQDVMIKQNKASVIQDGYWVHKDTAVKSYFDLDNTPIGNFCNSNPSVVINSSSIPKNTIKKLVFGDSYKNVTSINNNFMGNCTALTSLDLSALSNVTSIGDYFLIGCSALTSLGLSAFSNITSISDYFLYFCTALTSLDLSALSNITSIGINFLRGCSKLSQFKIGTVNVPSTSASGFLQSTTALTTILVPIQSVQDYKTTTPWSSHASKISAI